MPRNDDHQIAIAAKAAAMEATLQEHGREIAEIQAVIREMAVVSKENNDRFSAQLVRLNESVQQGFATISKSVSDVDSRTRTTNWPTIFAGGTFVVAIMFSFIASKVDPIASSFVAFKEKTESDKRHIEASIRDYRDMSLQAYEMSVRADERTKSAKN